MAGAGSRSHDLSGLVQLTIPPEKFRAFSMPRFFTMGNSCPFARLGSQNKMTPPRNLSEMLEELSNINIDDVDKTIDENSWSKHFRDFLKSRELSDEEIALRFLVLSQAIINLDGQMKQSKLSHDKRQLLRKQQESIFRKVVNNFFSEDSEEQISLSNQTLFNELSSVNLEAPNVTDQQLEYLRKAREDSSVTLELLEPCYLKFLEQYRPSLKACILSIL